MPAKPFLRTLSARERARRAPVLAVAIVLAAAGCSDSPTSSAPQPGDPRLTEAFQLETLPVTSCQYGGEYPNCKPKPPSGGSYSPTTSTTPVTGGSGGGGGGTGTGTTTTSEPPPMCDSQTTGCLKELTDADKEAINLALAKMKEQSEFSDATAAQQCAQLRSQLGQLLTAGAVFRGAPGIPDDASNPDASHTAEAWKRADGTWVIHIDGDALDRAEAAGVEGGWDSVILGWLLHESGHTLGFTHPGETQGPYTTPPFNHTDGGPSEQCAR